MHHSRAGHQCETAPAVRRTSTRPPIRTLPIVLSLTGTLLGGLGAGVRVAHAQAPDSVPLDTRMWIAAKMLSSVETYFAHWEGVPDLDLDSAFRAYSAKAAGASDRAEFSLASMEFLAALRNGHTGFFDTSLMQSGAAPLGFSLAQSADGWIVWQSQLLDLERGERVVTIDNRPVADYLADLLPYVSASSDREALRKVWTPAAGLLWPQRFTLGLADGRTFEIRRAEQTIQPVAPSRFEGRRLESGVAWLRIPSFQAPAMEDSAIAFLERNRDAPGLVIDVRGNGGGTSPTRLVKALMDRPYQGFGQSTAFDVGLYGAYHRIGEIVPAGSLDDYTQGYIDAFEGFDRPRIVFPGSVAQPDNPVYAGPVVILIDAACASACEDFVLPFKSSGRGTLIGEPTSGSTGQPFLWDFGNGMSFRVSSRRVYMPDGSQFEGVGILPDEEVRPTIEDLRTGRDPVRERALSMVGG